MRGLRRDRKEPRHEVISVRLTEERLQLLERMQKVYSARLGRAVSISEVAFLALDDRSPELDRDATRSELLLNGTAALLRIRGHWQAEQRLSLAEWDVLAEFVLVAAEQERREPPRQWPPVPSRESDLTLLTAFEAVYQSRATRASPNVGSYFRYLDGRLRDLAFSDLDADQQHEVLIAQVARLRERLRTDDEWHAPSLGRCFVRAVREEGVSSARLDFVLAAHWPALWRLAARGHWIRHQQPVRGSRETQPTLIHAGALPPRRTIGTVTLSFMPLDEIEFTTTVRFESPRSIAVMIESYPELAECRAMFEGPPDQLLIGRYVAVAPSMPEGTLSWSIKRQAVGIELSASEWQAFGDLMRGAWQHPELRRRLHELEQQYGEHG